MRFFFLQHIMNKFLIFLYFLLISNSLLQNTSASEIFESKYKKLDFISNNIETDKVIKIDEIKFESLDNILFNILITDDYINFKKKINKDLINTLIKNIIIEDEKIINNHYSALIKVNYNEKKIVNYLIENQISYVAFLPENILTIIFEDHNLNKNLFSINNNHYKYLKNNEPDNLIYLSPNLDINDRYLLNYNDIINLNINKINKFNEKYYRNNSLIIISYEKNGLINYRNFFISKNKIINLKKRSYNIGNNYLIFKDIKRELIDEWKKINIIQTKYLNSINCEFNYFNIQELKELKKNINNLSIIKNTTLNKISYKKSNYILYYYGNIEILSTLLSKYGLKIILFKDNCKIYLNE